GGHRQERRQFRRYPGPHASARAGVTLSAAQPEPRRRGGWNIRQRPQRGQKRRAPRDRGDKDSEQLGGRAADPVDYYRRPHIAIATAGAEKRVEQRCERQRDRQRPERLRDRVRPRRATRKPPAEQNMRQRARQQDQDRSENHRRDDDRDDGGPHDRRDPALPAY